jgi:hypothetical protein
MGGIKKTEKTLCRTSKIRSLKIRRRSESSSSRYYGVLVMGGIKKTKETFYRYSKRGRSFKIR